MNVRTSKRKKTRQYSTALTSDFLLQILQVRAGGDGVESAMFRRKGFETSNGGDACWAYQVFVGNLGWGVTSRTLFSAVEVRPFRLRGRSVLSCVEKPITPTTRARTFRLFLTLPTPGLS